MCGRGPGFAEGPVGCDNVSITLYSPKIEYHTNLLVGSRRPMDLKLGMYLETCGKWSHTEFWKNNKIRGGNGVFVIVLKLLKFNVDFDHFTFIELQKPANG